MKFASLSSLDTNWRIWESEETNLPGDISRKEIIARNESPLLFLGGFCSIKTRSKQAIHQYESDFHISFWLKWFEMIQTLSELHKMKPAKLEWNYHYHYSTAAVLLSSLSYLTWAAHFFSQVSFTSCHWLRKFPWIRWPSNCSMSASALHSLPLTARGWHVGST